MRPKILIIGLYCSMLSACASGIDLAKAEIDDTIHTSSVTTESVGAADATRLSDVAIIRNAVSSADLQQGTGSVLGERGDRLAWLNHQSRRI